MGYFVFNFIILSSLILVSCGSSGKSKSQNSKQDTVKESRMKKDTIPTPPVAQPNPLKNARNAKLICKILNIHSVKKDSSVIYQIKVLKLLKRGRYAPIIAAGDTIRVLAQGRKTTLKKGEKGKCIINKRLIVAQSDNIKKPKLELINWENH